MSRKFDPSVLGYTHADIEAMQPVDRQEAVIECLARSEDLLTAIVGAFTPEMKPTDIDAVKQAIRLIRRTYRE